MRFRSGTWLVGIGVLLMSSAGAFGAGFSVFTQGAKALGQANAVVAHSDSPSTLFYNPAIMNDLPGTHIEIGTTMVYDDREFESDLNGDTTEGEGNARFPSTLYLTHALNDRWSMGLAVFNPFGLGTEWPDDWEGRFVATETELTTYVINPVVSFRITPRLSIAAGVDYMLLDSSLKRKLNLNLIGPFGEGGQEVSADGDAWGYNLGLFARLTERLHLGLSYRSKYDAELNGDVDSDLPAGLPGGVAGAIPDTDASVNLDLPDQFLAGLAYHFNDRFVVEASFRWEGWSRYERLKVDLDESILGQDSEVLDKDWDDSYGFLFGGEYRVNDTWSIMAGYLFEKNPIPDSTFEPSNPDADSHVFSAGTSFRYKGFEACVAYAFQHEERRDKDNDIGVVGGDATFSANGAYESDVHFVALSLGYAF